MRKSKNKNSKLYLIIGALIVIAVGYYWYSSSRYQYFLSTPVNAQNSTSISFVIKKGDDVGSIAENLFNKDLILDEGAFKTYAKDNGVDRKIFAGRFMLNETMTIPQIASEITNPDEGQLTLTIPEGTTIQGIDQKLVALNAIQPGDFVQATKDFNDYAKYPFLNKQKMENLPYPLEGYLFPDTYYINLSHFNSQDLISEMLNDFAVRLPSDAQALAAQNNRSLYDVIIMASIVEKEANTGTDRQMVAGVLWKRLDAGWPLGSDVTSLYLKNGDTTLNAQDLASNSPYNTRVNPGLPPGPVCNPGLVSIEAALNPQTSPYFYFLADPNTGNIIYAVTNDEQNANKAKYLQ